MKRNGTISGTKTRNAGAKSRKADHQTMQDKVLGYINSNVKNIDKTQLAMYVGVALLVIYGIRKSNLMGSLTISLITAAISKFFAAELEHEHLIQAEAHSN